MKALLPLKTLKTIILLLSFFCISGPIKAAVKLAEQPNLSPDGKTLLFVRGGDVWQVPTRGGQASRMTSHSAKESQPIFSPSGQRVAFVSNRTGSNQVYVMPAAGGQPKQLT
ncbi:MAG: hypothetical protein HOK57_08865, partial [Planctomycetaceae bacterium]|nr:hypothetical protein [Planctomycetaceae bacterium]